MLKPWIVENSSDQNLDFINNESFQTNSVTVNENNAIEHVDEEHLECLFKETDNEMVPGEFPLECDLVEIPDDIHPCNRCGRLFFSKEYLKRHKEECDRREKRESCRYCKKRFTRFGNKCLHEQHCKVGPSDKRQKKRTLTQTNIDNYVKRPRIDNFITEQVGGSAVPNEHSETWRAPELVESTLKRTAVTYRKEFDDSNRKELQQRLLTVMNTFTPIIQGEIVSKKGVKWYLSLRLIFCQAKDVTDLTDPPVVFRSEVFTSLDDSKLSINFKVAYNQMLQQIEEFQRNGSGWVVHHFLALDLGKYTFICVLVKIL